MRKVRKALFPFGSHRQHTDFQLGLELEIAFGEDCPSCVVSEGHPSGRTSLLLPSPTASKWSMSNQEHLIHDISVYSQKKIYQRISHGVGSQVTSVKPEAFLSASSLFLVGQRLTETRQCPSLPEAPDITIQTLSTTQVSQPRLYLLRFSKIAYYRSV
jgi:hypothetical protein